MRSKSLLNDLKLRKTNMRSFFFMALLVLASSSFAQVQHNKVRLVPTVEGDAETEFLFLTHVTDTAPGNTGISLVPIDNDKLDLSTSGAWIEYQILSPEGGDFLVQFAMGTRIANVQINIGAYKTEKEFWPETGLGDTVNIDQGGNWNARSEPYYLPIYGLEANETYTLRLNYLNSTGDNGWCGNIYSLSVVELTQSIDNTLKDLKVNGETIEGFSPDIYDYTLALPPDQWIEGIEAFANDDLATVEMPEISDPEGSKTSVAIKVTSEAGISVTYTVNLIIPVFVADGTPLVMSDYYYSKGVAASDEKVNSIANNEYIDYYVYSEYDQNMELTFSCVNGYGTGSSYLNVSTLGLNDDDEWVVNDIYTQLIEPTYDELEVSSWDQQYAKDYTFTFALKELEPTLIRIYGMTPNSNTADIFSMTFKEVFESIDATLSEITVDGKPVEGFDPMKTSYNIPLPAQATTTNIVAKANDTDAIGVEGDGDVDIAGFKTTDTLTVTAESGFSVGYILNFYTPVELQFVDDTVSLMMGDWLFTNGGPRVTNAEISYFLDSMYVDYYIYSPTDKDVHLVMNVASGNPDTMYAKINVSAFSAGSEWMLNDAATWMIPSMGENMWGAEFASDVKYNLSLTGGEATILRIFGMTDGWGSGNIHRLALVNGATDFVAIESVEANEVKVLSGYRSLTVLCDEAFVGGSVQLYDLSGRLVKSQLVSSDRTVMDVDRNGLYIVKLQGANNAVQTVKCIVR